TFTTEKSLPTKHAARATKAPSTNRNWPDAIGRAVARRAGRPVAAPAKESAACASASASAMTRAKWPSSGITSLAFLAGEGRLVHRVAGALQGVGRLRRHVVLVVLGEHLARR